MSELRRMMDTGIFKSQEKDGKEPEGSEELPLTLMGRILEADHQDAFSNSEKGELLETTMTTKNSNSKTVIFFFCSNIQPHLFRISALIFLLTG